MYLNNEDGTKFELTTGNFFKELSLNKFYNAEKHYFKEKPCSRRNISIL